MHRQQRQAAEHAASNGEGTIREISARVAIRAAKGSALFQVRSRMAKGHDCSAPELDLGFGIEPHCQFLLRSSGVPPIQPLYSKNTVVAPRSPINHKPNEG